jgi:hypothetical protein
MYTSECYPGYSINGRYSYFTVLDKNGQLLLNEDFVKKVNNYKHFIFKGDIIEQSKDLISLIRQLIKLNTDNEVQLEVTGKEKPKGFNTLINTVFVIHINLKEEYNLDILEWFTLCKSLFIFEIEIENELNEVIEFIKSQNLKRHLCYILYKNDNLLNGCYINEFNIIRGC